MSENSFEGIVKTFTNVGIHAFCAEIMTIRQQITVRNELRTRSGWDNSMQNYIVKALEKLRDTVENICYNPDVLSQEELEAQAVDTTRSIADDYNTRAIASDNILMPNTLPRTLAYVLDGTDLDVPIVDKNNCPNETLRLFIKGLDELMVQSTRLDDRNNRNLISKYSGAMLVSLINELYTLAVRKGGESNRLDIPVGVLPSQELVEAYHPTTTP